MVEKREKTGGAFPRFDAWNWRKMAQDFLNFARSQFMASFDAFSLIQNQTYKMLSTLISQSLNMQEEGRRMLEEWMNTMKKEMDKIRNLWETNFKRAQDLFVEKES